MMNEPISTIMTTDVVTVGPDDNLATVKELLFSKRFEHIPVVKGPNKKLVGIVTPHDLLVLNRKFEEYASIRVADVMTTKIATFRPLE